MSDSLHDRFGERLGEVARLWRVQMNRRLQSHGLSVAQWLVLRALARKGDGTVQRDLAEAIGVEGSTLVGLLDRLAKAGLIERREAAHDRRYKSVHLSAAAQDLIPVLDEVHRGLRHELFGDIPERDLATGLEVLERVLARIEGLAGRAAEDRPAAMAER
ncbi:MAG: MarR family transcriptional regulator [Alphaproteobacteria bacterium]|jgi:MarR family transcriptional regulator for hemolysin|nr:MarR family transcriptional regulator [Alphaproteobacteria bacterium]